MSEPSDDKVGKKRTGGPKKVTAGYLERAALHYLGRFSTTEENLRKVLERKVRRRNEGHAAPTDEQTTWINEVVEKCVKYGYVDDEVYARQRSESLLRKGKPPRQILQDLRFKGVDEGTATAAVDDLEDDDVGADATRRAAAAYVRRRRFGPFRRPLADPSEKREKEIAAMMRVGFPYGIVVETLDGTEEDLLELLP
ncbi:regulatory protein RecX [Kordiimonas sp.]|uniref:regulatory protein RecX n=1 Tax=Kordiimonas sp. TaxID=1970157 RepID=UPI003A93FABE